MEGVPLGEDTVEQGMAARVIGELVMVGIVILGDIVGVIVVFIMAAGASKRGGFRPPQSGDVKCANSKCRYVWRAKNIFRYRCPKCKTRVRWI